VVNVTLVLTWSTFVGFHTLRLFIRSHCIARFSIPFSFSPPFGVQSHPTTNDNQSYLNHIICREDGSQCMLWPCSSLRFDSRVWELCRSSEMSGGTESFCGSTGYVTPMMDKTMRSKRHWLLLPYSLITHTIRPLCVCCVFVLCVSCRFLVLCLPCTNNAHSPSNVQSWDVFGHELDLCLVLSRQSSAHRWR